MSDKLLKVLLVIEQCNPDFSSDPLLGFNFFKEISKVVEVTLVTHERNRTALHKRGYHKNIIYISESSFYQKYYQFMIFFVDKVKKEFLRRPLSLALFYPLYSDFNQQVYEKFKTQVIRGDYSVVHAVTPTHTRYPFRIVKACTHTPFLLGPVNGGVPFPEWFEEIAIKKTLNLSFLINIAKFVMPGYLETYKRADKILAGSTFTLNMLKAKFALKDDRIDLFPENSISNEFLTVAVRDKKNIGKITLLFLGRLVAFKCPDILIEAVDRLNEKFKDKIQLIIVGDGQERPYLERKVQELQLGKLVTFVGWVHHEKTLEYYRQADIFCFPSIRESGGAVVLEAMACGLPCIVAKNGGIAEYVTEETGFRIEPLSREYLIQELKNKIELLVDDQELRERMSAKCIERAWEFEWGHKSRKIVEIYQKMILEKAGIVKEKANFPG